MNMDAHLDVINACRFCFMCRHLSPVGNVTHKEADTPRGRSLILDKVRMDRKYLNNTDYIKTLYDAELSAACRYHCVSHYDEAALILAARRDAVEAGLVPNNVKALAEELKNAKFEIEGSGDVLYYIDRYTEQQPEILEAFQGIAGEVKVIRGGDAGKALSVLGYTDEAKQVAEKFATAVKSSGCKTLVVSCPAAYDAFKNDFPIEGITVLHSSEFLLQQGINANAGKTAYYLDSDYLKNYNENLPAPRELLQSLGYELKPFGTNNEESYSAGEGGVVYDLLTPGLAEKLCRRIAGLVDDAQNDLLITASPYTRYVLEKFQPELNAITLEQAAAEVLESIHAASNIQ